MSYVGGDPDRISRGAVLLDQVGRSVEPTSQRVAKSGGTAADSAGDEALAAAVDRLAACWSHRLQALALELGAAATLAENAGADLATADGQGPAD